MVLSANDVEYDQQNNIVRANGEVEIMQGQTIVLADHLTYDQAKNLVKVRGNVSLLEAGGNVMFADELELKDDLKAGVVNQFKMRLADNSLMAAARARKVDENITRLRKGVYSPCNVCEDGSAPMWQIRADTVTVNQEEQKVAYNDATMEVYGVPVLYTPYFAHPTPDADNKSGLLEPQFQQSTNLGAVFKQPVYYTISPDRDITLTPIYTSLEGPVLAGQYRQRFDNGLIDTDGSFTRPQSRDAGGAVDKGQQWRGHLDATGKFTEGDHYNWGFDVHRTTDDTYLRRYGFSNDTLLTSRIYGEGVNFMDGGQRSYAGVKALKFDGLTAADDSHRAPLVMPLADFNWQSPRGPLDSRLSLDSNAMALTRQEGAQSRRLSNTLGWNLPYITQNGQVLELATHFRADMYSVAHQPLENGRKFDGETGRLVPEATLTWRYPFINYGEHVNMLLEPVVMMSVSPNGGNPEEIPNEDSKLPEFNASNLFAPNRFAGYDRVEGGPQLSYGLRGQAQLYSNKYIDWLVGQHYQQRNNANFPFSNDLNSHASDYVGKFGINYDAFSLAYRTRLDKDTLSPKRNEVDAGFNYYPVGLNVSYLALRNDPSLQSKEELVGTGTLNLNRQWQFSLSGRRDLQLGQITGIATGLEFKNECVDIINTLGKEYTQDRDIKPATTYLFRISLKNLD